MSAIAFPTQPRQPARPAPRGAARPHLRLVAPPTHTARYLVLLVAITALGVLGVVSVNALAAEAAFKAAELESEVDTLAVRYDELTAEVARLESPDRVRQVAIDELGMVPAADPVYLQLDDAVPAAAVSGADQGPAGDDVVITDPVKRALGERR